MSGFKFWLLTSLTQKHVFCVITFILSELLLSFLSFIFFFLSLFFLFSLFFHPFFPSIPLSFFIVSFVLLCRVFTLPQYSAYTPRNLQPKFPWVSCLQEEHKLWTRTLNRHKREGFPESVVSRMSGPPPETTEDITHIKDTHPVPGY